MSDLSTLRGSYSIDPQFSEIALVARHAMITNVRGLFRGYDGRITAAGQDLEDSSVELTIQVDSLDTANTDRDVHLRSADFFDAAAHPEIRFVSTKVELDGDDSLLVTGDLTVKGVTHEVMLPLTYLGRARHDGADRVAFEGVTMIHRSSFDLTWNAALETGGVLVSDLIRIEVAASLVPVPAAH